MPDKRSVDELSIEELERILAIKKREARQERLRRMKAAGRVIEPAGPPSHPAEPDILDFDFGSKSNDNGLPAQMVSAPEGSITRRAAVPQFEETVDFRKAKEENNRVWRRFVDRSLLLVEVAAVIGLIVLGVALVDGIDMLQRETAQVQASADEQIRASIPTIAPTPQLQLASIVLPGGHTPPTEPGGGQFNFDEIPPNLRALVRDQIFLPPEIERPPITPETPRRLVIPDINVDHVIVQGVDWEALKLGIGQLPNGATPRDPTGNVVLAAHNDIYGEIFRYLDRLEPGMYFQIHTDTQIHNYIITELDIVAPDAVHVMESQGRPTATLISCYPYQVNDRRIVVFAERIDA